MVDRLPQRTRLLRQNGFCGTVQGDRMASTRRQREIARRRGIGHDGCGIKPFRRGAAHRKKHGWTQVELADKLGWSGSYLSDIERGARGMGDDFAIRCDELFDTPGTFMRLLEQMRSNAYPPYFAPVIPYERGAARIHGWELGVVPGLLQTAEYARSVIRARHPRYDDEAMERKVTARLDRQEILSRPNPPLLWLTIHEGVLRHVIGSPRIMGAQLDRLIKAAESPGIVLQVLPFSAHDHPGAGGPIFAYEPPGGGATVAYTECDGGGRIVEHPDEVADLMTVIEMLRAVALSPRESVRLMRQIRSDLDELPEVELQQRFRRRVRRGRVGRCRACTRLEGRRRRPGAPRPRQRMAAIHGGAALAYGYLLSG